MSPSTFDYVQALRNLRQTTPVLVTELGHVHTLAMNMSPTHTGKTDRQAETTRHIEQSGHGDEEKRHGNKLLAHSRFAVDTDELPRGYFRSAIFRGTFAALGMDICAATASSSHTPLQGLYSSTVTCQKTSCSACRRKYLPAIHHLPESHRSITTRPCSLPAPISSKTCLCVSYIPSSLKFVMAVVPETDCSKARA